jgi:formylglycine-generating enzyme required for sulfatase activity
MRTISKLSIACGIAVWISVTTPGAAQPSPSVEVQLFAGVNLIGTPGEIYAVQASSNPSQTDSWSSLAFVQLPSTNYLFVDTSTAAMGNRFFRTLQQTAPTNMVFIPPGTFTMGSPTNELHRSVNEGPQTRVTLTHGFWMGRYEVTQREYLDVTGTNPSYFPGVLDGPVSSVSWPDATNYCWLLTQRELAAGRIPPGSRYRLPTEAEWEYAARAGTSTRFSYGDDLDYANLNDYAWHMLNGALTIHPVGQKLPNPWGLYDMHGNVWEWCQDWLGDLTGGNTVDPQGPPSNSTGWKVVRGGGYDFSDSDCRSSRRYFFGSHPALNDTNLGFRVVLSSP